MGWASRGLSVSLLTASSKRDQKGRLTIGIGKQQGDDDVQDPSVDSGCIDYRKVDQERKCPDLAIFLLSVDVSPQILGWIRDLPSHGNES
jgi:hypothetical protein